MNRWYKLSQAAAKAALQYRLRKNLGYDTPCDIYDLITRENVDLQFVDIPSLEGMCLQEPEVTRICVCADRPWGRQRFTAAHELGHFVMGHGTQVDTVIESRDENDGLSDEEILADGFARFLLMPPRAVARALAGRRSEARSIYEAGCWLGVGYATLIKQMCVSLGLIDNSTEEALLRHKRQELAQQIVGDQDFKGDVWPLDELWRDRRVHVQIGDVIHGIRPTADSFLGSLGPTTAKAKSVGTETVSLSAGGTVRILVSERRFTGFYDYRYLPE